MGRILLTDLKTREKERDGKHTSTGLSHSLRSSKSMWEKTSIDTTVDAVTGQVLGGGVMSEHRQNRQHSSRLEAL